MTDPPPKKPTRYCIQCGERIDRAPVCPNPDCAAPNYYRDIESPASTLAPPSADDPGGRVAAQGRTSHAGKPGRLASTADMPSLEAGERHTMPLNVAPCALLRSMSPSSRPAEFLIYPGSTEIGAVAPAQVVIDHPQVSSRHACLHCRRGSQGWEFVLEDRGSTNGTSVNGQAIERQRVKPKDRLSFADLEFELVLLENDDRRRTQLRDSDR